MDDCSVCIKYDQNYRKVGKSLTSDIFLFVQFSIVEFIEDLIRMKATWQKKDTNIVWHSALTSGAIWSYVIVCKSEFLQYVLKNIVELFTKVEGSRNKN